MRKIFSLLLVAALLCCLPAAFAEETAQEPVSGFEGLRFSEVVASNQGSLNTEYGTTPDWLEIENSTDQDMDLSGLWLTDSKKVLNKYVFPEGTTLKAGAFMVIYASGVEGVMGGDTHVAFKLSAAGETVAMYSNGIRVDSLQYPALEPDIAFALDEKGSFSMTSTPTPGEANLITPVEE